MPLFPTNLNALRCAYAWDRKDVCCVKGASGRLQEALTVKCVERWVVQGAVKGRAFCNPRLSCK
eukprot:1159420-Pelagomonas_calceolata.AAC.2